MKKQRKAASPAVQVIRASEVTTKPHEIEIDFLEGVNFTIDPGASIDEIFNGAQCFGHMAISLVEVLTRSDPAKMSRNALTDVTHVLETILRLNRQLISVVHSEFYVATREVTA